MSSISEQSVLFCPCGEFQDKDDEFRWVNFGESPIFLEIEELLPHLRPLDRCNNNKEHTYDSFFCGICENSLKGTTFYICKECDAIAYGYGYYHEECIKPISKHPYHPKHSLRRIYTYDQRCVSCLRRGTYGDIVYDCSICDFNLCEFCVREPPIIEINNPKTHKHTLFYFNRKELLICDVCALSDRRSLMYFCLQCNFAVHGVCVYLPSIIRISRHEHRLSFNSSLTPEKWLCRVCRGKIDTNYGRYSCVKGCNVGVHSVCATKKYVWDGKELEGEQEEDEFEDINKSFKEISNGIIQHFSHQNHYMRLDKETNRSFDENKHCQACTLSICDDIIYNCMECDFILHQECAHLPLKKLHPLHPHPLSLQVNHPDGYFECIACDRKSNGFSYICCYEEDCNFELDVCCVSLGDSLHPPFHPHPIYLTQDFNSSQLCSICGVYTYPCLNCEECDFILCFKDATLPHKMRYKHDQHFLIFSYGEGVEDQYVCESCEENANPKNGIYICNVCDVTLHIKCLFRKDIHILPFREIKINEAIVNVLLDNHLTRNICQNCYNHCQDIVFKVCDGESFCSFYCLNSFIYRDE